MSSEYDFRALEEKWRPYWQDMDLYKTSTDPEKPKYYILDFFPYPSGDGLSVGHGRNYVPTCVSARFMRMRGYNVLHPMGWDAFGLPAENYAIKHGIHPKITTRRHCDNYRRQMKLLECSYDWSREFSSTDPDYYRWTQWFFLLLFKRGLAYRALSNQWWCPIDQTILANEQVENGRCWRCGSEVTKKALQQWHFRITDYGERLLADLEEIDWPEPIKLMQRNWIGRSEGAQISFAVQGDGQRVIKAFTTRPDTLFGVTFLVLAPEHPLVTEITTESQRGAVAGYIAQAQRMTELDRLSTDKEKTGIFTGAYAVHPATGAEIPVWVADYVLLGYGTGAVMGVPGHDSRDFAFAEKVGLPIVEVVSPDGRPQGTAACFTEPGVMINSGGYSGLTSEEGGRQVVDALAVRGLAEEKVTYKMRDWLISRQRYWGAPIPIIHCPECGPVAVPEDELPVELPDIEDFAPSGDGRSPLARVKEWVNTSCPHCGGPAQRETDTMDGFACSSWYFLRFASPWEDEQPFDPAAMRYWLPVDTYVGGAEHAVMHLLYARFWTKVMYDAGLVPFVEPFSQLRNQGVLHASDGRRMSKSKGNVVTPDEVVAEHGTDATRAYILFIGPFDGDVNWNEENIKGVNRFLERYWYLAQEIAALPDSEAAAPDEAAEARFRRRQHEVIRRITGDYESFKFNTAVAALMEYLNDLYGFRHETIPPTLWREALATFTQLLAPVAPFVTEEVWQEMLGRREGSVHRTSWPAYDEALMAADEITMMIQVNGKLRDKVTVSVGANESELRAAALAQPNIQRYVDGQTIRRVVIVPEKLINIVIS